MSVENLLKDLVPLDDVAEPVFGIRKQLASRRAAKNELPIPAFRLNASGRGPFYVHCEDLAAYIDSSRMKASSGLTKKKVSS